MPINPSALSGADDSGDPADGRDPDIAADAAAAQEEQPKRTRRTKAQMIADAVVPADDAQVELKDAGTGAKIQRPWLVAVEMVREGKAEWADKSMKYALMKYDQQKAAPAFEPPEGETEAEKAERLDGPYGLDPAKQDTKSENIPPEAEVGDEVLANDSVFRVGHGGVLTNQHSPVSIEGEIVHAKRRWQRGADNEWRSADLSTSDDAQPDIPAERPTPAPEVAQTNGRGDGEVTSRASASRVRRSTSRTAPSRSAPACSRRSACPTTRPSRSARSPSRAPSSTTAGAPWRPSTTAASAR
jgi:hypothetical protein